MPTSSSPKGQAGLQTAGGAGARVGIPARRSLGPQGPQANEWLQNNVPNHITSGANSPDLNIVDNVWGILKGCLEDKPPATLPALKQRLAKEWNALPQETMGCVRQWGRCAEAYVRII